MQEKMNRTVSWDRRLYTRPKYPYQKWAEVDNGGSIVDCKDVVLKKGGDGGSGGGGVNSRNRPSSDNDNISENTERSENTENASWTTSHELLKQVASPVKDAKLKNNIHFTKDNFSGKETPAEKENLKNMISETYEISKSFTSDTNTFSNDMISATSDISKKLTSEKPRGRVRNTEDIPSGYITPDAIEPCLTMANFRDFILQKADHGEARYPLTVGTEGYTIRNFIETKVEKLRDFLHANFRMFKDCQILKQGSVYEGTKIGNPDEFDFMIEIPSVLKYNAVRIVSPSLIENQNAFYCEIVDSAFFSDISAHPLSRYNATRDGTDPTSDLAFLSFERTKIIKILLIKVSRIFQSKFDELFPDECKYKSLHTQVEVERALTFTLLWKGKQFPWLPISVDFVLGVPLHETLVSDKRTHAVFFNHEPRISFSCLETSYLSQFPICDGRLRFMRLMKWFKENYFYKVVSVHLIGSCFISSRSVISTYWIKNIVFYMHQIYQADKPTPGTRNDKKPTIYATEFTDTELPERVIAEIKDIKGEHFNQELPRREVIIDGEAFSDQELPHRVVEALEILLECCQKQTLHSFYFPEKNLMNVGDEYADDREEKVENLEVIARNTRALLEAIRCMESDPNSLSQLREQRRATNEMSDSEIKQALFRRTIKELADYARKGYPQDGLDRLKAFCAYLNDFHGADYTITGRGVEIEFTADGNPVDIVGEMLKIHQTGKVLEKSTT